MLRTGLITALLALALAGCGEEKATPSQGEEKSSTSDGDNTGEVIQEGEPTALCQFVADGPVDEDDLAAIEDGCLNRDGVPVTITTTTCPDGRPEYTVIYPDGSDLQAASDGTWQSFSGDDAPVPGAAC